MQFTDGLAAYAAILSTLVFAWNVHASRPNIRVRLILAFETKGDKPVHGVLVVVQNPSNRAVHLGSVALLYPWRKATAKDYLEQIFRFRRFPSRVGWSHTSLDYYGIESNCPVTLEPGKAHRVMLPHDKLEEILSDATSRKLIAVAQDALWRNKYSRPFEYPKISP